MEGPVTETALSSSAPPNRPIFFCLEHFEVSPEQAVQRAFGKFQSKGGRFSWLLPGSNIWFRFVELKRIWQVSA